MSKSISKKKKEAEKPLVSIFTPFYNALPYFKDLITCIKYQDYRPLEFIAVDDGSTDGSWEYLQKVKPELEENGIIVKAVTQEHANQSVAVNKALSLVEGEFITWTDADDLITNDCISKKVEYLLQHPEIGMCRSDWIVVLNKVSDLQEQATSRGAKEEDKKTKNIFEDMLTGATYCDARNYMIRSSLFFECYPEKKIVECKAGQNLQLILPAASRTDCGFVPEILYVYCHRSNSHSTLKRSYLEQKERIEDYTYLLKETLKYCLVDQEYYSNLIDQIEKKRKNVLYYTLATKAVQDIRKSS